MSRLIRQQEAQYKTITAPASYAGNPLIEALPEIYSEEDVLSDVQYLPKVAFKLECSLPKHERLHCVSAIDDLVIAFPALFEVESALSIMLRRGYAVRNPFSRSWRKSAMCIQDVMNKPIEEYQTRSKSIPAMMITSVSGGGKTTLIENLLEMYPQVISHTAYKEATFSVKQLVWIRVNASFDASLRGLVLSLFGAVDNALQTNYRSQYENSKASVDTMLGRWAQIVTTHHLGVLFVDEVQCLALRGDAEANLALSLFLKIGNECKLPIIFGGTYSAVKLFSNVARNARRVCSGGYFDLQLPSSFRDAMWDKGTVQVVWKYQWVSNPAPLDDELRATFYELTQGILAVLVALHRTAQLYAIRQGLDRVDAAVIRKVYKTQFVLLHPALNALKSKSRKRLEKFEDLLPPKDQLDALLAPTANEARADLIERLLAMNAKELEQMASEPSGKGATKTNAGEKEAHKAKNTNSGKQAEALGALLHKAGGNPGLLKLARQAGLVGANESGGEEPSEESI